MHFFICLVEICFFFKKKKLDNARLTQTTTYIFIKSNWDLIRNK